MRFPLTGAVVVMPPIDQARIGQIKADQDQLETPVIMILENRLAIFPDGNHRIVARLQLGLPDFETYVLSGHDAARFLVAPLPGSGA